LPIPHSRNSLALISQNSSGHFEKNVSPFEIAKMFNPSMGQEGEDLEMANRVYDGNKRQSFGFSETPNNRDLRQLKRRQTMMLKKIDTLKLDSENNNTLKRLK